MKLEIYKCDNCHQEFRERKVCWTIEDRNGVSRNGARHRLDVMHTLTCRYHAKLEQGAPMDLCPRCTLDALKVAISDLEK